MKPLDIEIKSLDNDTKVQGRALRFAFVGMMVELKSSGLRTGSHHLLQCILPLDGKDFEQRAVVVRTLDRYVEVRGQREKSYLVEFHFEGLTGDNRSRVREFTREIEREEREAKLASGAKKGSGES